MTCAPLRATAWSTPPRNACDEPSPVKAALIAARAAAGVGSVAHSELQWKALLKHKERIEKVRHVECCVFPATWNAASSLQ